MHIFKSFQTSPMKKTFLSILIFLLTACTPSVPSPTPQAPSATTSATVTASETPSPSPTATLTPTPQPRQQTQDYGIELEDFPKNVNPLTALEVSDPALLDLPAILISISNIPDTARPQAGVGSASWIFEYYIGEASTRFLGVFYGEYPRRVPNVTGDCPANEELLAPSEHWVGDRVWLDENENGKQDDWELGIGGVCVHLYNGEELLESTSTNSNGYYTFNLPQNQPYTIEFEIPDGYEMTTPNLGYEELDSDGQRVDIRSTAINQNIDLGLVLQESPATTPSPIVTGTPPGWYLPKEAYVGPIRSGRLTYDHINKMFHNSCLIFASAAADILAQLDPCWLIYGVDPSTPNSGLLTVAKMRELAEAQAVNGSMPNYSGNFFSESLPNLQRDPATYLRVYYHQYLQSAWAYDPISKSYLRYTDSMDGTGILHPATDRLTGRQQSFENVIVLQATHDVYRHNQLDINLRAGQGGFAWLLRDGEMMRVRWSTGNRAWEKTSGLRRPIHFVDVDGNPIALRPGHTWIHLMTPASYLKETGTSEWQATFVQPNDPPND